MRRVSLRLPFHFWNASLRTVRIASPPGPPAAYDGIGFSHSQRVDGLRSERHHISSRMTVLRGVICRPRDDSLEGVKSGV